MTMEEQIRQMIADVLRVDISIVDDDLSVGDIPEWDSLRHLTLIGTLTKEFAISFEQEELAEIENVEDIVNLVKDKAPC
jgi:acyl carrier protein